MKRTFAASLDLLFFALLRFFALLIFGGALSSVERAFRESEFGGVAG